MKINFNSEFRIPNSENAIRNSRFVIRKSERGMATFVLLVLLMIMLSLVTAESSALFHLHRELNLLEQHQIKRLDVSQTNSVAVTKPELK